MPYGLAADAAGNVYIADTSNSRTRRLNTDGSIATVVGNGSSGNGGDGGPAAGAQLNAPTGVAVDGAGNLYIAELSGNRVWKVWPDGTATTLAGNGLAAYAGDGGPAAQSSLSRPLGVAVDAAGNVYIADTGMPMKPCASIRRRAGSVRYPG